MPKPISNQKCSSNERISIDERKETSLPLHVLTYEGDNPFEVNHSINPRSKLDQNNSNSKKKASNNLPFPQQLFDILSKEEYKYIISWLPHGKSFFVHNKKKFVELVSPHYFKETKFESFTRKLNRWGFVRISKGPEIGAFQHEFFLRDDVSKSSRIRCQKKNDRKKPRCDVRRNMEEVVYGILSNENRLTKNPQSSFSTSLPSSMEDIKKAQMEQIKRSQILNYLCAKQQYEQWMEREMYLKAQASSQQQHEKQGSNDLKTKQHEPIPDTSQKQSFDFTSIGSQFPIVSSRQQQQQQQQPHKQIPQLLKKTDDMPFPVLSAVLHHPVPLEKSESITQSQNDVKTKQQNQEEQSRGGIEPKTAHNFVAKEKSSTSFATISYPVPLTSKQYYSNNKRDICHLPLKKKIKIRHLKDSACKSSISSSLDCVSIEKEGNIKRKIARRTSASAA